MLAALKEKPVMDCTEKAIYRVKADWDDESGCWTATSEDIPGLVLEAETLDEIRSLVMDVGPELIESNCGFHDFDVPLILQAEYVTKLKSGHI